MQRMPDKCKEMDLNTSEFLSLSFIENIGACTSTPISKAPSCSLIRNSNSPIKSRKRKISDVDDESEVDFKAKQICLSINSHVAVIPKSLSSDSVIDLSEGSSSVNTINDDTKCEKTVVEEGEDETLNDVNETLITISETHCTDATLTSQLSDISSIPLDAGDDSIIFVSPSQETTIDSVLFVSETFQDNRNNKESNAGYGLYDNAKRNQPGVHGRFDNLNYQRSTVSYANAIHTNPSKGRKRMIIIDGSNVAFAHSSPKNEFSVKGIDICINYFIEKGYEVKAVVPQMRLKRSNSTNSFLLEQLKDDGKLIITPCKSLPNGKSLTSYDDRFILDIAHEYDAVVISNDNYRDLVYENENYRNVIESRVIGYTFCNDLILLPKDPYGKNGPSLDYILKRQV